MRKLERILIVGQYIGLSESELAELVLDWLSLARIISTPIVFQRNRDKKEKFKLNETLDKIKNLGKKEDVWWKFESEPAKFQAHIKGDTLFCCNFLEKKVFAKYEKIIEDYFVPRMEQKGVYGYLRSFDEYQFNNIGNVEKRYFDTPEERQQLPKRYDVDHKIAIDCNQLSGYDLYYEGLCMTSCWKMYFGKYYYRYIPKTVFESIQQAYNISMLKNEMIEVTLYKNPWHWDLEVNLKYQRLFRDQVGFDQLAWENGVGLLREPYIEFAFEKERIHTVSYLDNSGQPTVKKAASIFVTRTFDLITGQYAEHKMKGYLNSQAFFPWVDESSKKMMNYCILNPEYALDRGAQAFEFYIREFLELDLEDDPHYQQYQPILRFYLPQANMFRMSFNNLYSKMSDVEFKEVTQGVKSPTYDLRKGENRLQIVFMDYAKIKKSKQFAPHLSKY